jgi:hypothetical protein
VNEINIEAISPWLQILWDQKDSDLSIRLVPMVMCRCLDQEVRSGPGGAPGAFGEEDPGHRSDSRLPVEPDQDEEADGVGFAVAFARPGTLGLDGFRFESPRPYRALIPRRRR